MLDVRYVTEPAHAYVRELDDQGTGCTAAQSTLEALVRGLPLQRRRLRAKQYVFRAGQPRHALHLIHAGVFKTSVISEDGREKITGFRLRGELLGLDALDMSTYACDAVALDVGEVWELPSAQLRETIPQFQELLTSALASEIRRDWGWMLALGTLTARGCSPAGSTRLAGSGAGRSG